MRVSFSLPGIAFLAALFILAGVSGARADDAAAIGYRQKLMQSQGFHAGSLGAILKGEWAHKEDAAAHAKGLAADAQLIVNAFKMQTADVKTDAKAEIWKDLAKFEEKAKGLETESAKLVEVAASGNMADIGAQVKKVGDACGACHKEFRKPKEQSYKN
jgi:cytochrome c556